MTAPTSGSYFELHGSRAANGSAESEAKRPARRCAFARQALAAAVDNFGRRGAEPSALAWNFLRRRPRRRLGEPIGGLI